MIVFFKNQVQKSVDMLAVSHSFGVAYLLFFSHVFLSTLSTLSTYKRLRVIRILGLFANPKLCVIVLIHPGSSYSAGSLSMQKKRGNFLGIVTGVK